MKNTRKYDKSLKAEFMPETLEIIEKPASPLGHIIIWLVVLLIVCVALWAYNCKIDEVITASAAVTPENGVQPVQSLYDGRIADILVKEGEHVDEGQALINLETATQEINIDKAESEKAKLEFQNELLEKLRNNEDISDTLSARGITDSEYTAIYDMVMSVYTEYSAKEESLTSQAEQYSKQIEIEENTLSKLKKNKESLSSQYTELMDYQNKMPETKLLLNYEQRLGTVSAELDEYKALYEKKAITEYQMKQKQSEYDELFDQTELQRVKAEKESSGNDYELSNLRSQIDLADKDIHTQENVVEKQQALHDTALQSVKTAETEYMATLSNMIFTNNNKIAEYTSQLSLQNEYNRSNTINAPVSGTVQKLVYNTVGGVVTPAQTLIMIVPDSDDLIAEAQILNKDIGDISVGQEVALKVDAYSFQKYGTITGKITYISPTATETEYKGLVYTARIELEKQDLGEDRYLSSGMTGTAEIKLGKRRVLEFFLEPLFEYFDDSLKVS